MRAGVAQQRPCMFAITRTMTQCIRAPHSCGIPWNRFCAANRSRLLPTCHERAPNQHRHCCSNKHVTCAHTHSRLRCTHATPLLDNIPQDPTLPTPPTLPTVIAIPLTVLQATQARTITAPGRLLGPRTSLSGTRPAGRQRPRRSFPRPPGSALSRTRPGRAAGVPAVAINQSLGARPFPCTGSIKLAASTNLSSAGQHGL
jgi:hypothetical protein